MSEDARYRTSTQYRFWSFAPETLCALRKETNQLAAIRVRAAVQRVREARALSSEPPSEPPSKAENGRATSAVPEGREREVDCLTVEEELCLVNYFSRQLLDMGTHMKFPADIQATGVQYLKRFYLTNSVMTYEPKAILKTALFLATKTDHFYMNLNDFVGNLAGNITTEDILAPEFTLTQGLRFMFDVRHPFRALEGVVMELQALAKGKIGVENGAGGDKLGSMPGGENGARRAKEMHGKARAYLKMNALLTDAYFHFTPSQIMFSAFIIADEELATWYIKLKFRDDAATREKVMSTMRKCADMLKQVKSETMSSEERQELQRLAKKLKRCMNPEKMDLIGLQRKKREGDGVDEKVVKKRKLERERSAREGEELFGPEIVKKG